MNKYSIKSGKENMQFDRIKELLKQTYWADNREESIIRKSIDNSVSYGAFLKDNNKQIAFARVITDFATTFYLCDVIVDENYRGMGVGKELVKTIINNDEIGKLRGVLTTSDAHSLYKKFGFETESDILMGKKSNLK